jgi:phosphoglycerate dehydrogenase-like enzyme
MPLKLIVSERVRREFGRRIRAAAPGVRFVVPSVLDGALLWSGDPAKADVCLFSEDMWAVPEMRQHVLPAVFRLQGLRWFHTFSAGTDAGVFQAMIDRGTILTNSSGASAPSIAQYVLAMMLYRTKPIEQWRSKQARAEWSQVQTAGELTGQTCGIIGIGSIGGEVARLAQAFGMRTVGMRRSEKKARFLDEQVRANQLSRLLSQSDFVVIACPLTKETEGLIGERELRAMKPTATLINVARGRVVDEGALIRALKEDAIASAVLDVFTFEPLPENSPLWSMSNVIVTPHNSGFSPLNMGRMIDIFLENLTRFTAGNTLRNRVT